MNALKLSIGVVCAVSLSFAQIPSDTVKKSLDIKISKTITFQHTNVERYMEDPSTVIVTGTESTDTMDIVLNRSFKQELSSNVDKETVERMF